METVLLHKSAFLYVTSIFRLSSFVFANALLTGITKTFVPFYSSFPEIFYIFVRMDDKLQQIDTLLGELNQYRANENYRITEALEIEYTYDSNRIEGNTLTLHETDMVVNKGITIAGKGLREHLEAINHKEAIDFIKDVAQKKEPISERVLLDIHAIVLHSIDKDNAGKCRRVPVIISGSKHIPPQPYLLQPKMDELFQWYEANKDSMHPVVLAAQMHEKLVSVHPFIDGNGRTARLLMNLILMQHGYPIANIKGDNETRRRYYETLEEASSGDNSAFVEFIEDVVIQSLTYYLKIIRG